MSEAEAGISAQHRAWKLLRAADVHAPIVDATDIQRDPRRTIGAWCDSVGLVRCDEALSWEPRMFPEWEVWPDWMDTVKKSMGFYPPPTHFPEVKSERLARLIDSMRPLYREMETHKLMG